MVRVFVRTVGRAMSANFAVVKFGECVSNIIIINWMGARCEVIHDINSCKLLSFDLICVMSTPHSIKPFIYCAESRPFFDK